MASPTPTVAAKTPTITVRRLEQAVQDRLRVRAAGNRRSMEAEIRAILTDAVASPVQAPASQQGAE